MAAMPLTAVKNIGAGMALEVYSRVANLPSQVKSWNATAKQYRAYRAQKSINWPNVYPLGFGSQQTDLLMSKAGAAAAFQLVAEVHNCISSLVGGIESLPWNIRRYEGGIRRENGKPIEGEIIASDDDLQIRHPLQRAFRRFHTYNNFSLLGTMALDYTLYGEVFLEVASNLYGQNQIIEWLNPLGVQVYATQQIDWFSYGWNNRFIRYTPDQLCYLHNRNPENDYAGYPQVLAVMDKVNIARNLDRFLRDYFLNNARPGLVVQPSDAETQWSDVDFHHVKNEFRESLKGVGGQYAAWITRLPVNLTAMEQPDLMKNGQLSEQETQAIYEKFSVPRAMRGNTQQSPYKSGNEVTERFYKDAIYPIAGILERFVNADVMPYFDQTGGMEVFEFDTSAYDQVTESDQLEEQIVTSQVNAGYLSLDEAQRIQERPIDRWMTGRYMVRGLPMTVDQIEQLIAAEIATAQAQAESGAQPQTLFSKPMPPAVLQQPEAKPLLPAGKSEAVETSVESETCACDHDHDALQSWQQALYADDPDEAAIDAILRGELKTWRTFELRHAGKAHRDFNTEALPPFLYLPLFDQLDTCETPDDIRAVFDDFLDQPRIKSIVTYQRSLRDLGTGLWRGEIEPGDFMTRVQNAISREFERAFYEGVSRSGMAREELSAADLKELVDQINTERDHVMSLAIWITTNNRAAGGKMMAVRGRVDNWVGRYRQMEELGYLVGSRDKRLRWKRNKRAKESCVDCIKLDGRVYTAKRWHEAGLRPGAHDKLQCQVWCLCGFEETTDPITRGRIPRLAGPRKSALDILATSQEKGIELTNDNA